MRDGRQAEFTTCVIDMPRWNICLVKPSPPWLISAEWVTSQSRKMLWANRIATMNLRRFSRGQSQRTQGQCSRYMTPYSLTQVRRVHVRPNCPFRRRRRFIVFLFFVVLFNFSNIAIIYTRVLIEKTDTCYDIVSSNEGVTRKIRFKSQQN